ncbi:DEAD/DEAH box helicase [Herbiconiux sp. CPCC 205763]|uniref:DEAD/DEAH box helicase n=1 Tax=Herbiconiux aconitum TaxID=2970913 RepID=A0ABT2GUY9_9MICO|nr:DEAD/DEAH box helicase [Herbiconiux aconitum]MCS5720025.1 DEAD/DEAH box helicase [Herbiconiux aconitum]
MKQASLRLSFSDGPLHVRLTAGAGWESDLRRMAPKFRSARQIGVDAVDVELDELLGSLVELASWPDPDTVEWAPELVAVVTSASADALHAERSLHGGATEAISPADLQAMLGPNWIGPLTDFQQRDVSALLSMRHGANFSVPGAGKTRVGAAVFSAAKHADEVERLLVVGPKSSYEAWLDELDGCFDKKFNVVVLDGHAPVSADVVIINYERLVASLPELTRWLAARPSMLILDEAHRMKLGADGAYGAACLALGPRAKRRLILTGTPAPNGVRDLENLFGFVWPGQGRQTVNRAVADGDLRHASTVLKPLFTRTTKKELGLKPEQTRVRALALSPLHREVYDALVSQVSNRSVSSPDDLRSLGKAVVYLLMAATSPALLSVGTTRYEPLAYQVPPLLAPVGTPLFDLMRDLPLYELSPKYQETVAIVAENARAGRKTLVWSTFVRSLTTLNELLRNYSPALVYGGSEDRESSIARFRSDPECFVLLSNPATLGEGISLHHECHDAVYVDRDFAAGRFLQSLDRIHRLGLAPDTDTRITVLTSEGTIDDVVNQRLELKLRFMGQILDDPAVERLGDLSEESAIGGSLDSGDIQSLLDHLRVSSS